MQRLYSGDQGFKTWCLSFQIIFLLLFLSNTSLKDRYCYWTVKSMQELRTRSLTKYSAQILLWKLVWHRELNPWTLHMTWWKQDEPVLAARVSAHNFASNPSLLGLHSHMEFYHCQQWSPPSAWSCPRQSQTRRSSRWYTCESCQIGRNASLWTPPQHLFKFRFWDVKFWLSKLKPKFWF